MLEIQFVNRTNHPVHFRYSEKSGITLFKVSDNPVLNKLRLLKCLIVSNYLKLRNIAKICKS